MYEDKHEYYGKLEGKLVAIALNLPPMPTEPLNSFMQLLEDIEIILPTDSWFHTRARRIASAGMLVRT